MNSPCSKPTKRLQVIIHPTKEKLLTRKSNFRLLTIQRHSLIQN